MDSGGIITIAILGELLRSQGSHGSMGALRRPRNTLNLNNLQLSTIKNVLYPGRLHNNVLPSGKAKWGGGRGELLKRKPMARNRLELRSIWRLPLHRAMRYTFIPC